MVSSPAAREPLGPGRSAALLEYLMKPLRAARPRPVARPRLGLEQLEDRLAPAAHILVSQDIGSGSPDQQLSGFTQSGTMAVARQIPPGSLSQQDARDLIMGPDGRIHVYNRTDSLYLSTFNPANNTWSHRSFPFWNSLISYGGIAVYQNYVYATD